MALWLTNLAAYSVQLAALVGVALFALAILRLNAPSATLRFWQLLFAASVFGPACQLWATGTGADSYELLRNAGPSQVLWTAATAAGDLQAGIAGFSDAVLVAALATLALGAAVRLSWLGLGLIRLRSIRATSERADVLLPLVRPLQQELGVAADIRFSDDVCSPATIGARRPVVLLPRAVCALPESIQRAVLCHELIHVRRRDWLSTLFEEVWCAVLWFHPAARVLASRLSLARETLVDQVTVAHTRDRRAYAAALLEFSSAPTRLAGAAAFVGRRHLARRIALLAQEVPMPRSSVAFRVAAAGTAVAIAALVASSTVPVRAATQAERIYKPSEDQGITLPRIIHEVKPQYTPAAMRAKIQGTVMMTAVVLASGDVGEVKVIESLDTEHGLDQQAVEATKQWKFEPGTKDGKAVAVEVTIEMTFTLKK